MLSPPVSYSPRVSQVRRRTLSSSDAACTTCRRRTRPMPRRTRSSKSVVRLLSLTQTLMSRSTLQAQYDKTKQRSLLKPQAAPLGGDQSFTNALASPALSSRQVPGTPRQTFVPAHATKNAGFGTQRSSSRASVSSRASGGRPSGGQPGWSGATGQQGRTSTTFGGGQQQQQQEAMRRPLGEQRANVPSRGSGGGGGFSKAPQHVHDGDTGMQFLGQQQQQAGGMGGARSGGAFAGFGRSASASAPGDFARLY